MGAIQATMLQVEAFTDPYCSWCWAAEPVQLRIREAYRGRLRFHVRLGGLVKNADDRLDREGRFMAWLRDHIQHVAAASGQPIDDAYLEHIGPGFSTWPACIQASAAYLQGPEAGDRFLRRMRRAIFTEGARAGDTEAALAWAADAELDVRAFSDALRDGRGTQAFFADRTRAAAAAVRGFPTLLVSGPGLADPVTLVGHRRFSQLEPLLARAAGMEPQAARPADGLVEAYGPLTTREVAVMRNIDHEAARRELEGLGLPRRDVGGDALWG